MSRRRDQAGISLVEIMMATAITGVVMVPLLGWAAFALRQQPVVKATAADSAAMSLIQTYYPRDVAGARIATDSPTAGDVCRADPPSTPPSPIPPPVAVLAVRSVAGTVAVYQTRRDAVGVSLWRRECVAPGGPSISTTELVDGVSTVTVTCADRPGRVGDRCGQVSMAIGRTERAPMTVTASRRIDSDLSRSLAERANEPPAAVIGASTESGTRPTPVFFDGTASSDPEGEALTYAWDFGDGVSSDPTPGHTFTTLGDHTVTLTVTDPGGATATAFVVITVENRRPTVSVAFSPSPVAPAATVQFDSTGTMDPDPGGRIVSWTWSFGDGSPASSSPSPAHSYAEIGTYSAVLTVVDDDGGESTAAVTVTVLDLPEGPTP